MNTPEAILVDDSIKSPRYVQVYSALYQWIQQGHYSPGARLEPESRLCDMFGVSRITVRKAIEMLTREQLVSTVQGKGTYVREDTPHTAVRADMNQRIRKARQLARNSKITGLAISTSPATAEVRKDLRLRADALVTNARYVRILNDNPIGYVESQFPDRLDIALSADDFRASTMLTILEDKGIPLSGIDHLVGATLADNTLARLLSINIGAPLVRVKMIMLDMQHEPVERVVAFFRADQYEHHMFMAREGRELAS